MVILLFPNRANRSMNEQELVNQISKASEGLLWLSESDYPFETVYWENIDSIESKLLEATNSVGHTMLQVKELDDFFSQTTQEEDWYNDEEMLICKRYQALADLLRTHLTDIKVYRVGEVEVSCYILGKTESGAIAGLSTISVET